MWRQVQHLVRERARIPIRVPSWFRHVAGHTFVDDVRVRRYFPAFVEACKTVCLLRSFQRFRKSLPSRGIEISFSDFAITAIILDDVFVESLTSGDDHSLEIRQALERIVAAHHGKAVGARELAKELNISKERAYAQLRKATEKGLIRRANRPEKTNRKLFLPAALVRFIPAPEDVFKKAKGIQEPIKFVHPLTGKQVVYSRSEREG